MTRINSLLFLLAIFCSAGTLMAQQNPTPTQAAPAVKKTCSDMLHDALQIQIQYNRRLRLAMRDSSTPLPSHSGSGYFEALEAAEKRCAEEDAELSAKLTELAQRRDELNRKACELRVTSNKDTNELCKGIQPKREVLENAHKLCNDWPVSIGPKLPMCSRLIPLPPAKQ